MATVEPRSSRPGGQTDAPWSHDDDGEPRHPLLIAGAILAGAIAFYLGMIVGAGSDIPANTTVMGVQIGGMSVEQATAVLDEQLSPQASQPFWVSAYGRTSEILPSDAGLSFDAAGTAQAASGRLLSPFSMIGRLFGPVAVDPVVRVDEGALDIRLEAFGATVSSAPEEPELHYTGLEPELQLGKDGQGIDVPSSREQVANGYLLATEPIALTEVNTPPSVSDEAATAVRDGFATTAVSAPVVVEVENHKPKIEPSTLAAATRYVAKDGTLVPEVDGAVLHEAIAPSIDNVETPGSDATFAISSDNVPQVVPAKQGKGVADQDLADAVAMAMANPNPDERRAPVPVTTRDPQVTTEAAQELGVTEEISSFTQEVSYSEYMAHNLALAAKYINGTLLLPGEVFSMNETTENHDPVNGYMEGYVIGPGGVFKKELGGGISAATTTMWTAAFFAGLEPVHVQAHSIYISRYTPGLEATVAWGGFDMTFRNNTPYGVFITADTTDTSMTVRMYSTKMFTKIEAEVGDRYWIEKPKTVYNPEPDCLETAGGEGFTIDVWRLFYQGDEVVNKEKFTTTYQPAPMVICGEEPKPEPDPQPDPEPSPSDGGSTDGGSTDGGATDGGATDGGATDGGAADGGSTDGGATDGGSTDGAIADGAAGDGSGAAVDGRALLGALVTGRRWG